MEEGKEEEEESRKTTTRCPLTCPLLPCLWPTETRMLWCTRSQCRCPSSTLSGRTPSCTKPGSDAAPHAVQTLGRFAESHRLTARLAVLQKWQCLALYCTLCRHCGSVWRSTVRYADIRQGRSSHTIDSMVCCGSGSV